MAIQCALETERGEWVHDLIMKWNKGIMNHDGARDKELLRRLKYGLYVTETPRWKKSVKLMREWDDDLD